MGINTLEYNNLGESTGALLNIVDPRPERTGRVNGGTRPPHRIYVPLECELKHVSGSVWYHCNEGTLSNSELFSDLIYPD